MVKLKQKTTGVIVGTFLSRRPEREKNNFQLFLLIVITDYVKLQTCERYWTGQGERCPYLNILTESENPAMEFSDASGC